MKPTDLLRYAFAFLTVGLIVGLLVTQLLGQPFIIFVETGSMSPTLEPNDGFIAVPKIIAGEIQKDDVVTFEAQELGGGGLTTHRVVRETEQGFITKGDANPFTDQAGDEPPVARGQIRSVGFTLGGGLVVVPGLGASITTVSSAVETVQVALFAPLGMEPPGVGVFSTGILLLGLVLYVYSATAGSAGRTGRSRSRGGLLGNPLVIIAILTLVVIVPVNFSMLLPSGVYQLEIVSSESPTESELVIGVGESSEVTYFMQNSGHLPVVVFLEPASGGVRTPEGYTYVPRLTRINSSVTVQAPNETGAYLRFVRESRYIALLPPSLIARLHGVHPILALVTINVVVATVVLVVSVATVGTRRIRLRSRRRELTIRQTLARVLPPLPISREPPPPRSPGFQDTAYDGFVPGVGGEGPGPPGPGSGPPAPGSGREIPPDGAGSDPGSEFDPGAEPFGEGGPGDLERLAGRELIEVYDTLRNPPDAAGIDAARWTPDLLQDHLEETYDVAYTRDDCARLLERAGRDRDGGPA